ncbi:hypothetical protein BABINDRAFT_163053 [Babjeviella inositovora NRRL Y-12698]|uniref:Clu domain-containing protein n=1 Tax=Babjeviella inositovora NRRL Y-12698 TaxID=984486 RepID=A0A1E3QJZ0_9ASCO|nr:uncharacterized protein BABINDRAFT_163053 [Babjeviella inositovora NRRL Y-12698]ODQ78006.1 hypothetical protein BABINDRAFT_163053 [Babjeviella inositovora NRRL Y-12698]
MSDEEPQVSVYALTVKFSSHLALDDLTIPDLFTELGISDSEVVVQLTEKPYTLKTVQEHLLRFRDLIGLNFSDTAASMVNSGASRFAALNLNDVQEKAEETTDEAKKTLSAEEQEAITALVDSIGVPSLSQHVADDSQVSMVPALKSLAVSAWSPVPAAQKLRGDLLYLTAQSLEHETYHITAHITGFFVNKSSAATFNPALKVNERGTFAKAHCLYDLFAGISPAFTTQLQISIAQLAALAPESYLQPQTTALSLPWLVAAAATVTPDASRSQLTYLTGGVDGAEHVHDWNEDYQSVRELLQADLPSRIMRERLLAKTSFEFTKTASATALSILQGDIAPMNPEDPAEYHIFLRNGIFYSFGGIDAAGQFAGAGGDDAARYAVSKDLQGVKCLNRLDPKQISGLVTAVVDYCGRRIVCQAPVPGILNQPQEEEGAATQEKILYGSAAEGTAIVADAGFHEILKPIAEAFHLKEHTAFAKTSSTDLVLSKDTKGLKGTDDRKYLIDLYRTTPLDIEFIDAHFTGDATSYPHRETVMRHEAIEEWWRRQVGVLIKEQAQKLDAEKVEGEDKEKEQIIVDGSQFALNPDAFPLVMPTDEAVQKQLGEDEKDVREVSKFISEVLVNEFLGDVGSANGMAPVDGSHLTATLHKIGINLRYLGKIAAEASARKDAEVVRVAEAKKVVAETKEEVKEEIKEEAKEETKEEAKEEREEKVPSKADFNPTIASYTTLYTVSVQEMIARASKHVLRAFSKDLPLPLLPAVVSHFHNCLLGAAVNPQPEFIVDETLKALFAADVSSVSQLTPAGVVTLLEAEVFKRFRYQLPAQWTETIKPVQLLREIAVKFGIQWKAQDYAFTAETFASFKVGQQQTVVEKAKKTKKAKKTAFVIRVIERTTTFVPEDIVNFSPVVKDSIYKSTLTEEILQAATNHVNQDQKEVGLTLFSEAISVYEQIYGPVHQETARAYTLLAQQYQDCGLVSEACKVSRKAVYLTERSFGSDSFETLLSLINSAFFEQANGNHVDSFKIYTRLLNDWNVIYGEGHPSAITTVSNLASILQKLNMTEVAASLFKLALTHSETVHGADSQLTGLIHFQYAQHCIMTSQLDDSVAHMEAAREIFTAHLGGEDSLTKDATKWAANLVNYKAFVDQQEEQKKKNLETVTNGSTAQKHKVKSLTEIAQAAAIATGKKAKKVKKEAVPDLADQSVEDILKFIEGKQPKKGKNAKKTA